MSAQLGWARVHDNSGTWARVRDDSGISSTTAVIERQGPIVSCIHAVRELPQRVAGYDCEKNATVREGRVWLPKQHQRTDRVTKGLTQNNTQRDSFLVTATRHQERRGTLKPAWVA